MKRSGKGPLRRVLSPRSGRRLGAVVLATVLGIAGCGGSGDHVDGDLTTASTTSSTVSSSITGAPAPGDGVDNPPPAPPGGDDFQGGTGPTSVPPPPGTEVALLSAVRVAGQPGFDRVVFELLDDQVPGFDIAYLDGPAIQDGSGEEVDVAGGARLEIRMAPASGVDLRQGTFEPTYTGPPRVRGDTEVVTEVVRTGDFEANLTWVIGVDEEVPYRVEVLAGPARIVIDFAAG